MYFTIISCEDLLLSKITYSKDSSEFTFPNQMSHRTTDRETQTPNIPSRKSLKWFILYKKVNIPSSDDTKTPASGTHTLDTHKYDYVGIKLISQHFFTWLNHLRKWYKNTYSKDLDNWNCCRNNLYFTMISGIASGSWW